MLKVLQDSYLIEIRGDVQDSLPDGSSENIQSSSTVEGENVKVYYMVHPAVDTEESSSFA
jgi:DNA replication licensing factor MCM6